MDRTLEEINDLLYETNEYGVRYQRTDVKLPQKAQDYLREEYGINQGRTLHRMCVNCQARQLIKYYSETKKFEVRCDGFHDNFSVSKEALEDVVLKKQMNEQKALLYLKSTVDPVAWCSLMFGFDDSVPEWRLRPYQKEQLRCNSLRMVVREGRRSGKTFVMALKIIYLLFNKLYFHGYDADGIPVYAGPRILVITPYQSQVNNLFNEVESIIKRNQSLASQIETGSSGSLYVKTPFFRMELKNGAKISGFVSGVGNKSDGSGGGVLRGQSADIIYLDEMDMIPDDILDKVVRPLLLTTDGVQLIATSTPIGKRGQFYRWCKENKKYKEDHFPSSVLPQWGNIKEEAEQETSKDGFFAEYMAEFIDGANGVFKPSYVYNAKQDYEYIDCENPEWWTRYAGVRNQSELLTAIGIDWNKNAGTEFAVVSYDPNKHHWFVVETTNIPATEFSSIAWKDEVIRLNYKWKPQYIYADEGYGHTIIEDLKLLAHNMQSKALKNHKDVQTAALKERLVSFNFSSTVELRSPIDNKLITKPAKEFIVENSIRIFEDNKLWYSQADDTLRKQLLNYVVISRNKSNGKPVYGPENHALGDHRLDAMMLALAALSLEYSIYSKKTSVFSEPKYVSKEELDTRSGPSPLELLNAVSSDPNEIGERKFRMDQNEFLKQFNKKNQEPSRADFNKPTTNSQSDLLERMIKLSENGNKQKLREISSSKFARRWGR